MPLDNSLNVSELLRRLGVKGDSLGSAPLLEALRLNLTIGNLSDLLPPVAVPVGGSRSFVTSGVGTFNKWTLQSMSPGGLTILKMFFDAGDQFNIWIRAANPFGAATTRATENYSFGQLAQSIFSQHPPAAAVAPNGGQTFILARDTNDYGHVTPIWVGPGEFFNIEANASNQSQLMSIMWKEYPAALNP